MNNYLDFQAYPLIHYLFRIDDVQFQNCKEWEEGKITHPNSTNPNATHSCLEMKVLIEYMFLVFLITPHTKMRIHRQPNMVP